MTLTIGPVEPHSRGEVYTVTADNQTISILLTFHALRRIAQWHLTVQSVLEALLRPEEVLRGHRGRFIAHRRSKRHVVRVIYEYEGKLPEVITVYYPYAKRYFQGGGTYEDHILA
jgi:Domain of unknown function (DUF4258)